MYTQLKSDDLPRECLLGWLFQYQFISIHDRDFTNVLSLPKHVTISVPDNHGFVIYLTRIKF